MSRNIYDNWQRLVEATLKREWERYVSRCESLSSITSDSSSIASDSISNSLREDVVVKSNSSNSKLDFGIPKDPTSHVVALDLKRGYGFAREKKKKNWLSKGFLQKKKEKKEHSTLPKFTFRELAAATHNFQPECLLGGEGGSSRVYKGRLQITGQVVAVKQFDQRGRRGKSEFLAKSEFVMEFLMLRLLHHPNIINMIGYCIDGDQPLVVYEYMPLGSLQDHLHDLPPDKQPLDWNTRMKIAAGVAKGLEYLHSEASLQVIHRDLKPSSILLDKGYRPKLSSFAVAKLGQSRDKFLLETRMTGTYGYCDPEYALTGQLSSKSDLYGFGVILLELITGRKAIDDTRDARERSLVAWARPLFNDQKNFPELVDPLLQGRYPVRGLYKALAVAAMCLQERAAARPPIEDVTTALIYLASQTYDPNASSTQRNEVGSSTQ